MYDRYFQKFLIYKHSSSSLKRSNETFNQKEDFCGIVENMNKRFIAFKIEEEFFIICLLLYNNYRLNKKEITKNLIFFSLSIVLYLFWKLIFIEPCTILRFVCFSLFSLRAIKFGYKGFKTARNSTTVIVFKK